MPINPYQSAGTLPAKPSTKKPRLSLWNGAATGIISFLFIAGLSFGLQMLESSGLGIGAPDWWMHFADYVFTPPAWILEHVPLLQWLSNSSWWSYYSATAIFLCSGVVIYGAAGALIQLIIRLISRSRDS